MERRLAVIQCDPARLEWKPHTPASPSLDQGCDNNLERQQQGDEQCHPIRIRRDDQGARYDNVVAATAVGEPEVVAAHQVLHHDGGGVKSVVVVVGGGAVKKTTKCPMSPTRPGTPQQGGEDRSPGSQEQQRSQPVNTAQPDPVPDPTSRVFVFGSSDIRERWKQVGLGPKSTSECNPPPTRRQSTAPGLKKLSTAKTRTQQVSMRSWAKRGGDDVTTRSESNVVSNAKRSPAVMCCNTTNRDKEEMVETTTGEPVLELGLKELTGAGEVVRASPRGAREEVGVRTRDLIGSTVSVKGKAPPRSPVTTVDRSREPM